MNKRILTILPTRNRPENVKRFIKAWKNTTSGLSDLAVVIDKDQVNMYLQALAGYQDEVKWVHVERMKLCPKLNYVVNYFINSFPSHFEYDIIGFLADDIVIKTKGWEEEVIRVIDSKGYGMCYPNDTIQEGNIPTHIFMSTNIIQALEFMIPPPFIHLYCDNYWRHIGHELRCLHYMEEVIMEHYHPSVGKAADDSQYQETYDRMDEDMQIYLDWIEKEAENDVKRVREALKI